MAGLTASEPGVISQPQIDGPDSGLGDWAVVVFNNDSNTWDEVIDILMKATACSEEEAEIETWEIDNLGKSVVHYGSETECETVAGVIRQIGIQVEVTKES